MLTGSSAAIRVSVGYETDVMIWDTSLFQLVDCCHGVVVVVIHA